MSTLHTARTFLRLSALLVLLLPLAYQATAHADAAFKKWISDFYLVASQQGACFQSELHTPAVKGD